MEDSEKLITESDIEILLEDVFRKESNMENIIIHEFSRLLDGTVRIEFRVEDEHVIYKNNSITIDPDDVFHLRLSERFEGSDVEYAINDRMSELIKIKQEYNGKFNIRETPRMGI